MPVGRINEPWRSDPSAVEETWDALFVADSQLHNVMGSHIKTQSPFSALASAVAVRPSELNLVSGLVLDETIRAYRQGVGARANASLFYLGDGLNLACGGEQEAFGAIIKKRGLPWFMAHGNHDSFMSGVFNTYMPLDEELNSSRMANLLLTIEQNGLAAGPAGSTGVVGAKPRPFYELSWWPKIEENDLNENGIRASDWPGVCAAVGRDGKPPAEAVPMNKLAWLAWYLGALSEQGVSLSKLGSRVDGARIEGTGKVGGFSVRVEGRLHAPSARYFTKSWESFVVQTVQLNDAAVVLLDTSVGDNVGNPRPTHVRETVGSKGRLGDEQVLVVREMLGRLKGVNHLIFAGHHPFEKLVPADRAALARLMKESGSTNYFSAHTHAPTSRHAAAGTEVLDTNIGSTTDWPMEAGVVRLSASSPQLRILSSGANCGLKYKRPRDAWSLVRRQSCVHAPVARLLATITPAEMDKLQKGATTWEDVPFNADCNEQDAAVSLRADLDIIEARSSQQPFRDFFLCLATAASRTQCGPGYDAPCPPPSPSPPPAPAGSQ